jgi:hypothetical protein
MPHLFLFWKIERYTGNPRYSLALSANSLIYIIKNGQNGDFSVKNGPVISEIKIHSS